MTFTKEQLIEELKSSTQNASGMFEISEGTICNLMSMLTYTAPQLPQPEVEENIALQNLRSAMNGIGHIRRTLEETFGGLHGTHCEPDVLVECKAICDAIYAAYRKTDNSPVIPDKWIPVSERMPLTPQENCLYEDVEVQVFAGDDVFIAHYAIGALPEPWGAWVDTGADITHWRPLAQPPRNK